MLRPMSPTPDDLLKAEADHGENDWESIPLVIVEGFLSAAGPLLWGNIEEHSCHSESVDDRRLRRKVIFARYVPFVVNAWATLTCYTKCRTSQFATRQSL